MKKYWGPAKALGLWAALLLAAGPLSAAESIRIKLATLAPKGSSIHQVLQQMGEKWKQASGGRITLTMFTDGSMGGEADMVRKMRIGQIHAAALTAVGLSEIDRSVAALQFIPMGFRSWEEVDHVIKQLGPKIEKDFAEKGFLVLAWSDAGWVHYFSKEPVLYPDDLKKMKLFVWAGGPEGVDLMKELGYQPVALETADILPGLQTGLINAVPSIPVYANAGQFFLQAPHMLDLNWAPIVGGLVISRKTWDKIGTDTQRAMLEAAREAGDKISERSRKENDDAIAAMQKRGLTVHPATPEVIAVWRQTAERVYPKIRSRIVPAAMFDEVQAILAKYRAEAASRP